MDDQEGPISTSLDILDITKIMAELVQNGEMSSIAKYSAALGPALMIFNVALALFLPDKKLDKEFFKVNRKLERIIHDVNNLQDEVKEWAVSNRYYTHIMNIRFQTEKLVEFLTSDISKRNHREDAFTRIYQSTDEDVNLFIIYDGLPLILDTAMTTSNYNRRNISSISNIFFDLIVMGIACSYTFEYINQRDYGAVIKKWAPKLMAAQQLMNNANSKCVQQGPKAAKKDMLDMLHKMDETNRSNQDYADQVLDHLTYTYNWLNWVVVVLDLQSSGSNTLFYCCNAIDVSQDGSSNRILAWHFPMNVRPMPKSCKDKFASIIGSRRRRPLMMAHRIYKHLKSTGLKGTFIVSRTKFNPAAAFDKKFGHTAVHGLVFAGYFV